MMSSLGLTCDLLFRRSIGNFFLIALLGLLCACTTLPQAPSVFDSGGLDSQALYTGRFSINYIKDGQQHNEQGRFDWRLAKTTAANTQLPAMQLSLLSPLGTRVAQIDYDPSAKTEQKARFISSGHTYAANDLDTLMRDTLGWSLPFSAIISWLDQSESTNLPTDWKLQLVSRHEHGLPKLITAQHQALGLSVRLVFEP